MDLAAYDAYFQGKLFDYELPHGRDPRSSQGPGRVSEAKDVTLIFEDRVSGCGVGISNRPAVFLYFRAIAQ